jgi:hypothetical protein
MKRRSRNRSHRSRIRENSDADCARCRNSPEFRYAVRTLISRQLKEDNVLALFRVNLDLLDLAFGDIHRQFDHF